MLKHLAAARRPTTITALALSALISMTSQDAIAQRRPAKPVSAPVTNSRMKGIWESVSYNQYTSSRPGSAGSRARAAQYSRR